MQAHRTSVTLKVGAVFVLLSLAFVTLMAVNAYLARQLIGASAAINQAGIQRMRVYKLAHLLRQAPPPGEAAASRAAVVAEADELDAVLRGLQDGDPERGLLGESDEGIRRRIQRIRDEWRGVLRPSVERALGAAAEGERAAALDDYERRASTLVADLSDVVGEIERRAAGRIDLLYALQFVFLLVAAGLVVAGFLALQRVVRAPLEKLARGVEEISVGALPSAIAIETNDELGRLARTFEMMAGRIRRHIEQLEALHATGQEITMIGSGGLDRALRRIVDRAADLARVDLALLMVRHPVLDCWVVEAASGEWYERVRKEILLLEETPYSNQAFETKQPVVVADLSLHVEGPLCFRDRYGAKSYMAVPLLGPHEAIGVLVLLHTKAMRTFSEWDIRLTQQFAAYAGSAIESARLFEAVESESRELKERLRAVERNVASLTHEVKAPAGRVAEFASWVKKDYGDRLDERALRYLDWIRKEGQDLFQLAERTLDLARISQEPCQVESVDTGEVVREVLDLVGGQHPLDRFQMVVADDLPRLACHRIHLKQVLENLVTNAIKYMGDQPSPRIEIGVERDQEGVVLFVRDNGIGMDPAMIDRIFLPFQRLGTVEVPGSGIGLSIVKTVIEQYGGTVTVTSTPGAGSTFSVRLPRLEIRQDEVGSGAGATVPADGRRT